MLFSSRPLQAVASSVMARSVTTSSTAWVATGPPALRTRRTDAGCAGWLASPLKALVVHATDAPDTVKVSGRNWSVASTTDGLPSNGYQRTPPSASTRPVASAAAGRLPGEVVKKASVAMVDVDPSPR